MQEYTFEPCPYCNGSNMLVESSRTKFEVHAVRCRKCDMQGPGSLCEEKAVDLWNRLPRFPLFQGAEASEVMRLLALIRELESCARFPL